MLKKVSHIIIASLVLASTAGMTVYEHYCGDKLKSISIINTGNSCCDNPSCCHDEAETYVIEDQYSVSKIDFEYTDYPTIVETTFEPYIVALTDNTSVVIRVDGPAPPDLHTALARSQAFLL